MKNKFIKGIALTLVLSTAGLPEIANAQTVQTTIQSKSSTSIVGGKTVTNTITKDNSKERVVNSTDGTTTTTAKFNKTTNMLTMISNGKETTIDLNKVKPNVPVPQPPTSGGIRPNDDGDYGDYVLSSGTCDGGKYGYWYNTDSSWYIICNGSGQSYNENDNDRLYKLSRDYRQKVKDTRNKEIEIAIDAGAEALTTILGILAAAGPETGGTSWIAAAIIGVGIGGKAVWDGCQLYSLHCDMKDIYSDIYNSR